MGLGLTIGLAVLPGMRYLPTSPAVRNADEAMDILKRSPSGRVTLEAAEDIPVYRLHGCSSPVGGHSWTIVNPRHYSRSSYYVKSGLPACNTGTNTAEGITKKGTLFDMTTSIPMPNARLGMMFPGGMPEIDVRYVTLQRSGLPTFWSGIR